MRSRTEQFNDKRCVTALDDLAQSAPCGGEKLAVYYFLFPFPYIPLLFVKANAYEVDGTLITIKLR